MPLIVRRQERSVMARSALLPAAGVLACWNDLQLPRREALRGSVKLIDHRLRNGWSERAFCALLERGAGYWGRIVAIRLELAREPARLHVLSYGGVHVRPVLDNVGQHQIGRDGRMAEGPARDVNTFFLGGLDDASLPGIEVSGDH